MTALGRLTYHASRMFGAVAVLVFLVAPTLSQAAATTLQGRVLGPAGVTPMPGAVVKFYNLVTGTLYRSEATDADGGYVLPGLGEGRYDVAIETDRGLWMVDRTVELGAAGRRNMSFALREKSYWEGGGTVPPRSSPIGDNFVGMAVILEDDDKAAGVPTGRGKKIGIGVGVAGGVLAVALIAGDDDKKASPFTP